MVLYSIIVGFSMGQILTAVGNVIQGNRPVRHYWVHSGWVMFTFFLHIFLWFSAWEYASIQVWSLGGFIMFLTIPVILFVVSVVALPEINPDTAYDLREYYFKICHWLHALLIAIIVLGATNEYLLLDQYPFSIRNAARGSAAAILFAGLFISKPRWHELQIAIVILLIGFFSVTYRESIGG
jgi:hypothetical protein